MRTRNLNFENEIINNIEKDWTIRNQRDIVNYRNRDRDKNRNTDVELVLTEENLSNVKNINDLTEENLRMFLNNVIKLANGRLNKISVARDVYMVDQKVENTFRKDVVNGLSTYLYEDPMDLSSTIASHFSRNKNVMKIEVDVTKRSFAIFVGTPDKQKLKTVEEEVAVETEDSKKKKELKKETVNVPVLTPVILLNYHYVR